ncbi:MAG: tetraacyldisaccharide 4'-kinase, partial [Desulfohalobiaceae bacterium]|nr:tetraacyldisaccharide 4'-kinase [Desulfohalobiaceae bacterium]
MMHLRAKGFAKDCFRSWRPPVPTVSVGNISWGGSGKTPLCQWIMAWSQRRNLLPLLLTRGHKAKPGSYPYLVRAESPVVSAGDEPLMLRRSLPGGLILVDPDRTRSGRWGWRKYRPDLFILDDGFQHLFVARDLDLVLLRPKDLNKQWNRVIPSGSWREGAGALKRATAFVFNIPPQTFKELQPLILRRLGPLQKPVFSFELKPTSFLRVMDNTRRAKLPGKDYLLVSGVGSPQKIEETAIQALGKKPLNHLAFPDHHSYTRKDWRKIKKAAASPGKAPILCTPKDSVKLDRFQDEDLWTFDLELQFGPSLLTDLAFPKWLEENLF